MYELKRNNESLYKFIVDLYLSCFNLKIKIDKIRRKYNTLDFGAINLGFLAFDNTQEVAAYYGVFPLKANVNNRIVSCAQSGDTMTSPKHQKKGLFILLANATYELCKAEGISFVFGFPNKNSFPGFERKLDWKFTGNMYKFSINRLNLPICELAYKFDLLNNFYQKWVNYILKPYIIDENNPHFNFQNTTDNFYIIRDKRFFDYKRQNSECKLIKFENFVFFIKAEGHLMVGDIEFQNNFDVKKCLDSLSKIARLLFCTRIIFYCSKNHWMYCEMSKYQIPEKSLPIGFKVTIENFDFDKFQFSLADFDTF